MSAYKSLFKLEIYFNNLMMLMNLLVRNEMLIELEQRETIFSGAPVAVPSVSHPRRLLFC